MTSRPARNPFISTEAEDGDEDDYDSEGELDGEALAELEEDYEEDMEEEDAATDAGDHPEQSKEAGRPSIGKMSRNTVEYKVY
jgi:hypothetical protein